MLALAVDLGGIILTTAFVLTVWQRRSEPTAQPLLGVALVMLAGVLGVASVVHLEAAGALAEAITGFGEESWLVLAFVYPVLAMGLWVPFGLQYTGRGDRIAAVIVVLVGVLVVVMVGPLLVNSAVGVPPAVEVANFASFVSLFVMGALSAVSLFVIIDESLQLGGYQLGEATVLSGAVAALVFVPVVATVTGHPSSFTAVMAASSLLFSVAVSRYDLFETLPVARVVGRDRVIGELDDAVVVVDRQGTVRDLNPAAGRYFGHDRSALGSAVESVLSVGIDLETVASAFGPVELVTADGRRLSVMGNQVTDNRDRLFGYLLVCQDVTARRDRERRLGVLNQLLVGALRERMERVADVSREIQAANEATLDEATLETTADEIWTTTTELTGLVARARDIERTLETGGAEQTDIGTQAQTVLGDRENQPTVTLPEQPTLTHLSPELLSAIIRTILDAFEAASHVEVTIREGPTLVLVGVDIDLPAAIEDGTAAGLAVEMVDLAVEHAGGTLSVTVDAGTSQVVIDLPGKRRARIGGERDRPEVRDP